MKIYISNTDMNSINREGLEVHMETAEIKSILGEQKIDRKFIIIKSARRLLRLLSGNKFLYKDEQGLLRLGDYREDYDEDDLG